MMDRIIYTRPDGGTAVVIPGRGVSLEAVEARSVPPDAINVTRVDSAALPDRVFRDAWVMNGRGVEVDMPKARAIHMDRIRVERNKELDRLDKEYAREAGRRNTAAADGIEAQREVLRNIPQTFDLSGATDAELDALWPAEVPRT